MTKRDCEHCRFWARGYVHDFEGAPINGNRGEGSNGSAGDCRRRAPTRGVDQTYATGEARVWPQTGRKDWCGDFESDAPTPTGTLGDAA